MYSNLFPNIDHSYRLEGVLSPELTLSQDIFPLEFGHKVFDDILGSSSGCSRTYLPRIWPSSPVYSCLGGTSSALGFASLFYNSFDGSIWLQNVGLKLVKSIDILYTV